MFLKSVKARGFKSFGRPVELAFEPGVTVVVGPNGSGKSNIADAVVWAMGEQSPTAIRGANMQDVIFSGSDELSPAGMADVEILLDNSSGILPIEFSEVSISRRLYRGGEGAYFINRSACRLIDVVELLADAGLGKNTHSIVSQGRVDAILESRPVERRAYIEEAAGLGKYKKRRHRAEKKLEAVKRNLERLADIEEEVRANLRPLKRQATAAERSGKLEARIAGARARLIKGRLKLAGAGLKAAEADSHGAAARRAELEEKLSVTSEERRRTEEELATALKRHKDLAARFYSLKSQRDSLSQRSEAIRQRREMLVAAGGRLAAGIENLKGRAGRVAEELKEAEEQRRRDLVRLEEIERELSARNAELERVDEELSRRRRDSEENTRRSGALAAAKERYRHQIEFLTQRGKKLEEAISVAATGLKAGLGELEALAVSAERGSQEAARLRLEAEGLAGALKDTVKARERVEAEHREAVSGLREVAEDLQIAKARLTFIGDSHRDRSGLPPAAKRVSEEHAVSSLIESIDVDTGYEQAVSAVLGSMVFALEVRDLDHARELLGHAREGELGTIEFILPGKEPVSGSRGSGEDYLVDHIVVSGNCAGHITALLSGVRVVDDISEMPGKGISGIWVTRDGVVFDPARRLLSYKADPPSSVVLRHRNERVQLEKERRAAETRHAELERRAASLAEGMKQARLREAKVLREHEDAGGSVQAQEDTLAEMERKIRALRQETGLKQSILDEYEAERSGLEAELEEAAKGLKEAEESLAGMSAATGGERDDESLKAERMAISRKVTDLQVAAARARERERVASLTLARVAPAGKRIEQEIALAAARHEAYRRLEPACGGLINTMARLENVFEQVAGALEQELRAGEEQSDRNSSALRELSRAEAELQQQLSRASDLSTEHEVEVARRRDQVAEQASSLESLIERYPDAGIADVEPVAADEFGQVEELIERLGRKLELIGPVNPLAQKEYEEMLERKEFLAEQRADLEKSLKELTGLIGELTSRIETSFSETFAAVRQNFTEVVATLFPGGEGRLSLVEPEEPGEETDDEDRQDEEDAAAAAPAERRGIEISVKPPRKAVRNLTLLSGGERSLVAIAFLFAIFLARPAPFYILDEVEAALDDINITRLLGMLRRYQNRTQFIVITHQKRTMEVADVLYGVSMSSDGTSRVLSRKMPPEEELAGEDSQAAPDHKEPAAVAG